MSKSMTAVICMVAVVLFVLPVKAQERDGSRLTTGGAQSLRRSATAHPRLLCVLIDEL